MNYIDLTEKNLNDLSEWLIQSEKNGLWLSISNKALILII